MAEITQGVHTEHLGYWYTHNTTQNLVPNDYIHAFSCCIQLVWVRGAMIMTNAKVSEISSKFLRHRITSMIIFRVHYFEKCISFKWGLESFKANENITLKFHWKDSCEFRNSLIKVMKHLNPPCNFNSQLPTSVCINWPACTQTGHLWNDTCIALLHLNLIWYRRQYFKRFEKRR